MEISFLYLFLKLNFYKRKMIKEINLANIRDEIIKHYPNLLWWDGKNKHEVFNKRKSYKHRQGMPNEIRIEFDYKNRDDSFMAINLTAINLYKAGYSFAIFYVEGGRSPHIHIYNLDELETLTYEQRTKYRELFIKRYIPPKYEADIGLCDEKHLCSLEFVNHFKYNQPKRLFHFFNAGNNQKIDIDLKFKVLFEEKLYKNDIKDNDIIYYSTYRDTIIKNCSFEKVLDNFGIEYKGHMAKCPFHNDTNNSLSFSNAKGLWKCFGCDERGDVITLVNKLLRLRDGDKKRS